MHICESVQWHENVLYFIIKLIAVENGLYFIIIIISIIHSMAELYYEKFSL